MIRLAIVGTGSMGANHIRQFQKIAGCQVVALCDVRLEAAQALAQEYGVPEAFGNVTDLVRKCAFDAAAVVVPDRFHVTVALELLAAGKHVLCEKPLAENYADASRMAEAAKAAGVINMVNFSYRDLPNLQAVANLCRSGELGAIRHVEARYYQSWLVSKSWGDWRTEDRWLWRLSSEHGSKGVLGDVGVHILDFVTFPTGHLRKLYCNLKTFHKAPGDRIGDYPLDANDTASIFGELENGAQAIVHTTRYATGHQNDLTLHVYGTKGAVRLDQAKSPLEYHVCLGENVDKFEWETVSAPKTPNNYFRFIQSIMTREQDQPDFARGAEIQKVLDACFVSSEQQASITLD
ncbi:MAG: Gfo/Idh/MocA family oxidoreductase [Verrucomicrobiota bacterium JB022]|nr:Gfo/Idh/MocA family oxidoreductase [Verrucomicrobiota bacterium JB022]